MASTYKGNKGNEDMLKDDSWIADSKSKIETEKTDSEIQSQSNIMSEEKSQTNEMPTNKMPVFKDIAKIRQDKQEQATLERLQAIVNEDNPRESCYTQDYIKSLEKDHLKEKIEHHTPPKEDVSPLKTFPTQKALKNLFILENLRYFFEKTCNFLES